MTDEQELRLTCLELAVEAGACPDCAEEVAEEFRAYVLGPLPDSITGILRGPFGRVMGDA